MPKMEQKSKEIVKTPMENEKNCVNSVKWFFLLFKAICVIWLFSPENYF